VPSKLQSHHNVSSMDHHHVDPTSELPFEQGFIAATQSPRLYSPSHSGQSSFGYAECYRAPRRAHTVSLNVPCAEAQMMAIARATNFGDCSPAGMGAVVPDVPSQIDAPMQAPRRNHRAKTVGSLPSSPFSMSPTSSAGSTAMNVSVCASFADGVLVDFVCQSRRRSSTSIVDTEGAPAPNLESFASEIVRSELASTDCFCAGFHGEQGALETMSSDEDDWDEEDEEDLDIFGLPLTPLDPAEAMLTLRTRQLRLSHLAAAGA